MDKETRKTYVKRLALHPDLISDDFAQLRLNEQDLHKHTIMELMPFNVLHFIHSGHQEIPFIKESRCLVMHYDPHTKKTTPYILHTHLLNQFSFS